MGFKGNQTTNEFKPKMTSHWKSTYNGVVE